jgi:predicted outer membrane protein
MDWKKLLFAPALFLSLVVPNCTSSLKYQKLLARHRHLELEHQEKTSALSRENSVLYNEKLEIEKQLELLRASYEKTRSQLAAETERFEAYRRSTNQQMQQLEDRLETVRQKRSRQINRLNERHKVAIDSLVGFIDTLSNQLAETRRELSSQVDSLKKEFIEKKFAYEKELYALEKLKDELFLRLQQKQKAFEDSLAALAQPPDTLDQQ